MATPPEVRQRMLPSCQTKGIKPLMYKEAGVSHTHVLEMASRLSNSTGKSLLSAVIKYIILFLRDLTLASPQRSLLRASTDRIANCC